MEKEASLPAPKPRVLVSALGDDTGVLLDLESQTYFSLNATGLFVWNELTAHPHTLESLTTALIGEFEVDDETARRDITDLVTELEAKGLVAPR